MSEPVCLLGPQRLRPSLETAIRDLRWTGPYAVITAGWEERESEVEELELHVPDRARNLFLFARAEEVIRADRDLFRAQQRYRDRRRELRELYRIRLSHGLDAVRELHRRRGDRTLLQAERREAVEAVRRLDANYLRRVRTLFSEFKEEWLEGDRPALSQHRAEILDLLAGSSAVLIAGGHVLSLLHSIRFFQLEPALRGKPVLAWSAGAMILGERVVLFHDNPPQGPGNAEVCDVGLEHYPGLVPLPHAGRRLHLEDRARVALFARRMSPSICVAMDDGARVLWDGARWWTGPGNAQLTPRGSVAPLDWPQWGGGE